MPVKNLLTNLDQLPAQVKKVLTVKYAAKPFGKLSEVEQIGHSIGLLLKINVVTGWPVPESDEQQNILAEQLKLYLIENWPLYNVDEIMYAIRSYATVLNNWGKNMNLSLIGSALADYEKERSDISSLEESKAIPQTTNLLTMQADWKELCEMYYQDYLNNRFNFSLMPYQLYDEFEKCNLIGKDAFEGWFYEARYYLVSQIKGELMGPLSANEKNDLENRLNAIKSMQNETKVEQQAKKFAVQFLYKTAHEKGFKNLFIKQT